MGNSSAAPPLAIQAQGSYAVGGTVKRVSAPEFGQLTLHGDHAFVRYQIPVSARRLPLTFLHGMLQFSKTWETTPDGREGFQNIFLRRGFGVYLIDQPRRGSAGQTIEPTPIASTPEDQRWFNIFRLGIWPNFFPEAQFARDPEALNQYFRQITPNTGPFSLEVVADAMAAHFKKAGPGILVTHSQGGGVGWASAVRSPNIRAIVSFEPASNFIFPIGQVPEPLISAWGPLAALSVPHEDFMRLTKIPIVIYYGDFIPDKPVESVGQDMWRVRLQMARLWADALNAQGGDVTVVHLPERGIYGNTHFPFSDLNNLQIADLMSEFLKAKKLD